MAVTYGFFNSVNGDRKYNADQMSEYFSGIINEGVFQHLDGGLAVTAGTGLAVNVASGRAIIQNKWVQNDASLALDIDSASETYARKDAVVVRLNWSSRAISIAVKTGTPAASPVAPSMTRNSTTYEMALAYVNVAANATSVTVTDKRSDSTVCGWVTVAQSTSGEVDAQLNAMKTGFDGVTYSSPVAMVQGCDGKLQKEVENMVIYQGESGTFNEGATVTPNASYSWKCFIPNKTLIKFTNNSSASMTLNVKDRNGNERNITTSVPASGGNIYFEAPFEIHTIRNYVGDTSSFDVTVEFQSTEVARKSLENEGYILNSTSRQPLYVNSGEDLIINVKSNTVTTNLFIAPYASGDNVLVLYANVTGQFIYHCSKSGFITLNDTGTSILATIKLNNNNGEKIFTVKKSGGGDFSSFVNCLNTIKDYDGNKTVYVYDGTYDIYEELGGDAFIASITNPSSVNWRDVNAVVPPNTKIIGVGKVTLQYTPTASQIGSDAMAYLFSPLNVSGNCEIENISIEATNCRYAIHDESSSIAAYDDSVHIYKNVKAHKIKGTYGQNATFASGIGARSRWYFKDCVFTNDIGVCWTVHTNNSAQNDMALIDFDSCIFAKDNGTNQPGMIQFISGNHLVQENDVYMSGCYVGGGVFLSAGGLSGLNQKYNLTVIGSKIASGIDVDSAFDSNPFVPQVYMPIS